MELSRGGSVLPAFFFSDDLDLLNLSEPRDFDLPVTHLLNELLFLGFQKLQSPILRGCRSWIWRQQFCTIGLGASLLRQCEPCTSTMRKLSPSWQTIYKGFALKVTLPFSCGKLLKYTSSTSHRTCLAWKIHEDVIKMFKFKTEEFRPRILCKTLATHKKLVQKWWKIWTMLASATSNAKKKLHYAVLWASPIFSTIGIFPSCDESNCQ